MNPVELASLKLLIRGFGVRVPGDAPVLTWADALRECPRQAPSEQAAGDIRVTSVRDHDQRLRRSQGGRPLVVCQCATPLADLAGHS